MGGEANIQILPFNLVGPNAPGQYSREEYEAIQAQTYPNVMPSYDEWRQQTEQFSPLPKFHQQIPPNYQQPSPSALQDLLPQAVGSGTAPNTCKQCGKPLPHSCSRPHRYCNSRCRWKAWDKRHPRH